VIDRGPKSFSYVGILNGGVILVHKVILDKLNGESALADTTAADDHKLVPEKGVSTCSSGAAGERGSRTQSWLVIAFYSIGEKKND